MKRFPFFLPIVGPTIFCFLFLLSCEKKEEEGVIYNPENKVFLQYRILNTGDQNVYVVNSSDVLSRSSAWLENGFGEGVVWLKKAITFRLEPDKGEKMVLTIGIQGEEAVKDLLELQDEELNYWERGWDYKTTTQEVENFYKKEGFIIDIGGSAFLLEPEFLEVNKVRKVIVDGEEKTFVDLSFSGKAFGVYDPYQEREGYLVEKGHFAGVIE